MRQKARVLTLTSSAVGQQPTSSDFYHDGRWEGQPMLPDLPGAAQLQASGKSSCCNTAHSSFGMTLQPSSSLIQQTGQKNKNLLWEQEFCIWKRGCAIGFWEYMFRILVTVCAHKVQTESHSVCPLVGIGTLPTALSPASVRQKNFFAEPIFI